MREKLYNKLKDSVKKKGSQETFSAKELADMQAELEMVFALRPVKSVGEERGKEYNWNCGEVGGGGVTMKEAGNR